MDESELKNLNEEELDELIHEMKAVEGADTNNRGREAQDAPVRREEMLATRKEFRSHVLAGMLLMREVMKAKIRKYGPDLSNVGMPRVGIKALEPWVDPGILSLAPETLELLADQLVLRLETEAMKHGYDHHDEVKAP